MTGTPRTFPSALAICSFVVSVGCIGEIGGGEPPPTPALATRGEDLLRYRTALERLKWRDGVVPVCWENPTSTNATERRWVEARVKATWARAANLSFRGWDACTSTFRGVRILIADMTAHSCIGRYGCASTITHDFCDGDVDASGACSGTMHRRLVGNMVLNFTFNNYATGCRASEAHRKYCVHGIAVHEFGHALGFMHEEAHPDNHVCASTASERAEALPIDGAAFDPLSVMYNCEPNNRWPSYGGRLSDGDKRGAARIYGAPGGRFSAISADGADVVPDPVVARPPESNDISVPPPPAPPPPMVPYYETHNPASYDTLLTGSYDEHAMTVGWGWWNYGEAGHVLTSGQYGAEPIYRMYKPSTGDHFYTLSYDESLGAYYGGYQYEVPPYYYAWRNPAPSTRPIYRAYCPGRRTHVFTWEWGLMDYALRYGPCSYEGIAFHVATRYCTPLTCADLDASCGALSDGCFSTIDCGYCASSSTCGGGGDENVCGSLCSGGGTWTYEAESQYHQIGAVNGAGWEVSPGSAGPGWLVYGPFTTALPRDAEYTASFRMLTNEGPYSDNPVVNIEVYDWYSGTMLAQRTIKQRDFAAAWQRQDFVLHFRTALAGSRLELRTYWWGYHYVHADLVDVRGCPRECSLDYESCASTPCCDGVQCNPINQRCQVACAIGNACASSADCCAGQSCNSGGRCYVPCPEGRACVTNADCCGGQMCWDRVCRNEGSVCLGAGELCRGIRVGGDPFPPCCAGLACGADDHCAGSTGTGTCVSAGMSCFTPSGERLTCCAGTICGTDGLCR